MAKGLGYAEMAAALGTTQEAIDRQVTELFRRHGRRGAAAGAWTSSSGCTPRWWSRGLGPTLRRSSRPRSPSGWRPARDARSSQEEVEVTVLFSDIRGFSTLAERLGARDVAAMVGRHLSAMAEVVAEHGGTIDKFPGDAVMAVFGAPEPAAGPRRARPAVRAGDAGAAGRAERATAGTSTDLPDWTWGSG